MPHAEPCKVGGTIETRHRAPFSTSAEFCRVGGECIRRHSLASYHGETFLANFYGGACLEQSTGVPMPAASSLNGGYYLISGDQLYANDPHLTVDASYREVE